MRPVVFVKYYDKASTIMSADQISEGLRGLGLESHSIYPDRIGDFRDTVMIFIKTSKVHHLWRARRRGNRTVLDIHDTLVFKRRVKSARLFDALIFKNSRQLEDFGRTGSPDRVIYLHWDPRFRPHEAGEEELSIGYLGDRRSLELWGAVPGLECVDRDYFDQALRFNCHLSIRQPGRESLYKPGAKVVAAAGCKAGLVTSPCESALELLGEDYPYYTGHLLDEVTAAIDRVRETIGGPEWRLALELLAEVRRRTALPRILQDYTKLAAALD